MSKNKFHSIAHQQLSGVTGGVTRASGGSNNQNQQVEMLMAQINDSIKALLSGQNNNSSSMMMPMMMMMMGGGGGGGGQQGAPPPPPPPPSPAGTMIKVNVGG